MTKILIINLPKKTKNIKGCWSQGFPIHKGKSENSLNYATVYANQNNIIPNSRILEKDHKNFISTLKKSGFKLNIL